MNRILLTGAAGIVGTALRPILAARYQHVVLTDLQPVIDLAANESYVEADITDYEAMAQLANQVEGIVHLAGRVGSQYNFEEVLGPNIVGTYHIYRAAHAAGVQRVVYASSHHAIGFHSRGTDLNEETAHRPDSHYGLGKAFGESAGAYFADNFGLNILAIRIGYVGTQVTDERRLHTWISPRDLAQLIDIGLSGKVRGYQVVYGTSEVPEPFFDNGNASRLGYQPQDRALEHLADLAIPQQKADPNTIAGGCVGGGFAAVGFQGDLKQVLSS